MDVRTHPSIDQGLCGVPTALGEGSATVVLHTTAAMAADERGLVHGGFVFGAADYAAMLAVNDPNVVLGGSECRFTAPVTAGQEVVLTAQRTSSKGRKHTIEVTGRAAGATVFTGTFVTFVLDRHVLDS